MKPRHTLLFTLVIESLITMGQHTAIELTFTAVNNLTYIQMDSIKIMNRTQGGDTTVYWPDTVLSIYYVGIPEISKGEIGFQVIQNYPNPVADKTTISLFVPEKDQVNIIVMDIFGRVMLKSDRVLDRGTHFFLFTPGTANLYFFTAEWRGKRSSHKILHTIINSSATISLEYTGSEALTPQLKSTESIQYFNFSVGDELLCIGYANNLQSGILDGPEMNETYTFQFATNIPCPGTPTVNYEGQVYSTIQILSQCWLKENLNVGWMIPGIGNMTDNGFKEKFCYNDEPDSCAKYGGLYEWNEMMQYTTQQGTQGICPPGWHLPTDEEWKVLEGAVDSQYGIGDPEWDMEWQYRGLDAGTNLKSRSGWYGGVSGSDLFGFSALPGGSHLSYSVFDKIGYYGHYWTSTQDYTGYAKYRYMDFISPGVYRRNSNLDYGISVRCIRNIVYSDFIELTFNARNNTSHLKLDSIKVMNRSQGGETILVWPDTTIILPYELPFNDGDDLLFIGYSDILESGILDTPEGSQTYTFLFTTNTPCPGTPTVEYGGQVYNTIQIFNQCWFKENLNIGNMIPGNQGQSNNGTIEKYCYNNEPDSCTKYGGLYQWNEMMQYNTQQGVQGICPPGWHLPTNEEWKVLEGAVDSMYGIGDPEWEGWGGSFGFDAGTNLKTTNSWLGNGNGTDLFGFSALPGGETDIDGNFFNIGDLGFWWSSTENYEDNVWFRDLSYDSPQVYHLSWIFLENGFSVRCLRNDVYIESIE